MVCVVNQLLDMVIVRYMVYLVNQLIAMNTIRKMVYLVNRVLAMYNCCLDRFSSCNHVPFV